MIPTVSSPSTSSSPSNPGLRREPEAWRLRYGRSSPGLGGRSVTNTAPSTGSFSWIITFLTRYFASWFTRPTIPGAAPLTERTIAVVHPDTPRGMAGSPPAAPLTSAGVVDASPSAAGGSGSSAGHEGPSIGLTRSGKEAKPKMEKNGLKAIREHLEASNFPAIFTRDPTILNKERQAYATAAEIASSLPGTTRPLTSLGHSLFEAQGPRPTMEDAHAYVEMEKGALALVFDGHGGAAVSRYAAERFKTLFPGRLASLGGNVHATFETLIDEIQEEILARDEWEEIGSAAVICYIDKENGKVYTATMGDSEANIYRKIPGRDGKVRRSIALSCVRDWSSRKDAARAAASLGDPGLFREWTRPGCNSKLCRYPSSIKRWDATLERETFNIVNVSRGFGDRAFAGTRELPGSVHKPKITVQTMLPGDILTLVCDGVKDYVPEYAIAETITTHEREGEHSMASNLGRAALETMRRETAARIAEKRKKGKTITGKESVGDNVSVMVIMAR